MDALVRSWRLLLIAGAVGVFACSPAKGEPVGVSHGGGDRDRVIEAGAADAAMLEGLPADFRASWKRVGDRVTSEHGRFIADVYEADRGSPALRGFAEDLFVGDAGVGTYLIDHGEDGGARFGVADARGRVVAGSVELCARCHRDAPSAIFPFGKN